MKILILYAATTGFDNGLSSIVKKIREIFEELGVTIDEVNLLYSQIPFYDGIQSKSVESVTTALAEADGVIFATTTQLFAPCAVMQTFLEHLDLPEHARILNEKNCMLITLSRDTGERVAIDYLAKIVNHLGGYDSIRIPIGGKNQKLIGRDENVIKIIEKQVEDFYRMVRQERKFFQSDSKITPQTEERRIPTIPQQEDRGIPQQLPQLQDARMIPQSIPAQDDRRIPQQLPQQDARVIPQQIPQQDDRRMPQDDIINPAVKQTEPFTKDEYDAILKAEKRNKLTTSELQQKVNMENFTKQQEEDINEITQFFASKYSAHGPDRDDYLEAEPFPTPKPVATKQPVVPRTKSCKQMTQSLPHYFQPHLAAGYSFTVQLIISGGEIFDVYLVIDNNECTCHEGIAQNSDITILSDTTVWNDILRGKHTAQKAFMIGQLKVRGNFVMLTKFEQLFKKMQ